MGGSKKGMRTKQTDPAKAYATGYKSGFMAGRRERGAQEPRTEAKHIPEPTEEAKRLEDALKRQTEQIRKIRTANQMFRAALERDGYHIRGKIEAYYAWRDATEAAR